MWLRFGTAVHPLAVRTIRVAIAQLVDRCLHVPSIGLWNASTARSLGSDFNPPGPVMTSFTSRSFNRHHFSPCAIAERSARRSSPTTSACRSTRRRSATRLTSKRWNRRATPSTWCYAVGEATRSLIGKTTTARRTSTSSASPADDGCCVSRRTHQMGLPDSKRATAPGGQ